MTSKLLPENSTKLEKDLADAFDRNGELDLGVDKLATAKYGGTPPNSYLPFLIWEYNLGEVTEWVSDQREVLSRGLEFQRIRGTKKSLEIALGWIGYTPATIEERVFGHWANFQMDTGEIPKASLITNIVKLSNLAKPLRSRLLRLYHGLDLKPLTFDCEDAGLDLGLFDNFSGTYDAENDVWLSFLDRQGFTFDLSAEEPTLDCRSEIHVRCTIDESEIDGPVLDVEYDGEHESLGVGTFELTGFALHVPTQVSTDCQSPDTIINELEEILGVGEG